MRAISLLAVLWSVAFPVTHALIITLPSTSITVGNLTITYQSEATDPAGNLTFYISHLGGVGGYFDLEQDILPHTTPTKLQLSLFPQIGDGQQWAVSAGPSTQTVDGIFATSDPILILAPSSSSASTSASAQSSTTPSSSSASSLPISLSTPSPTDTSVSSNTTSSPSGSGVASATKSSPSVGLIVGVTFGVTALLLILLLLTFLRFKKARHRRRLELEPRSPIEPAFIPHAVFATVHTDSSSANASLPPKIEPFMYMSTGAASVLPTNDSTTRLSSKARQEYLLNQMRTLQALQASSPSASETGSEPDASSDGLAQARRQNEALQERIRTLEAQLQSQWALGLSDEPPPGYLE
ncbi:hypothetical protein DFH07DRAFT_93095 [Mycena maculata]|uniref:Mid2 domain-containing protein n=1 Tax=Mycena maculata TaxID=230809 RepID=A0AAD7MYM7_9AGAR|nr:hypothetical protein DFH07DRAFT_93095 [Mycena maculata]